MVKTMLIGIYTPRSGSKTEEAAVISEEKNFVGPVNGFTTDTLASHFHTPHGMDTAFSSTGSTLEEGEWRFGIYLAKAF